MLKLDTFDHPHTMIKVFRQVCKLPINICAINKFTNILLLKIFVLTKLSIAMLQEERSQKLVVANVWYKARP